MTASDGNFYIAMAFDEKDQPVLRVGQGHGMRLFETLGKAKGQRKRWVNGTRWGRNQLVHHYPRSKVFKVVYAIGQLVAEEVECEDSPSRRRGRK